MKEGLCQIDRRR